MKKVKKEYKDPEVLKEIQDLLDQKEKMVLKENQEMLVTLEKKELEEKMAIKVRPVIKDHMDHKAQEDLMVTKDQ